MYHEKQINHKMPKTERVRDYMMRGIASWIARPGASVTGNLRSKPQTATTATTASFVSTDVGKRSSMDDDIYALPYGKNEKAHSSTDSLSTPHLSDASGSGSGSQTSDDDIESRSARDSTYDDEKVGKTEKEVPIDLA